MKLLNGTEYEIPMQPGSALEKHFSDPYNYTKEIMAQFHWEYYKGLIPEDARIVLDIGANVGLFALHISTLPKLERLICVEPTPEHMKLQKEVLAHLPFVTHEEAALAGHTGRTTFHWCGINTTMNSLQPRGDRSMEVAAITLEDLLDKYKLDKVDFCKIDIEGSEDVAVTVATLKPVADKLPNVFIELHPPDAISQQKWKAIFEECGYDVEIMFHDALMCSR